MRDTEWRAGSETAVDRLCRTVLEEEGDQQAVETMARIARPMVRLRKEEGPRPADAAVHTAADWFGLPAKQAWPPIDGDWWPRAADDEASPLDTEDRLAVVAAAAAQHQAATGAWGALVSLKPEGDVAKDARVIQTADGWTRVVQCVETPEELTARSNEQSDIKRHRAEGRPGRGRRVQREPGAALVGLADHVNRTTKANGVIVERTGTKRDRETGGTYRRVVSQARDGRLRATLEPPRYWQPTTEDALEEVRAICTMLAWRATGQEETPWKPAERRTAAIVGGELAARSVFAAAGLSSPFSSLAVDHVEEARRLCAENAELGAMVIRTARSTERECAKMRGDRQINRAVRNQPTLREPDWKDVLATGCPEAPGERVRAAMRQRGESTLEPDAGARAAERPARQRADTTAERASRTPSPRTP